MSNNHNSGGGSIEKFGQSSNWSLYKGFIIQLESDIEELKKQLQKNTPFLTGDSANLLTAFTIEKSRHSEARIVYAALLETYGHLLKFQSITKEQKQNYVLKARLGVEERLRRENLYEANIFENEDHRENRYSYRNIYYKIVSLVHPDTSSINTEQLRENQQKEAQDWNESITRTSHILKIYFNSNTSKQFEIFTHKILFEILIKLNGINSPMHNKFQDIIQSFGKSQSELILDIENVFTDIPEKYKSFYQKIIIQAALSQLKKEDVMTFEEVHAKYLSLYEEKKNLEDQLKSALNFGGKVGFTFEAVTYGQMEVDLDLHVQATSKLYKVIDQLNKKISALENLNYNNQTSKVVLLSTEDKTEVQQSGFNPKTYQEILNILPSFIVKLQEESRTFVNNLLLNDSREFTKLIIGDGYNNFEITVIYNSDQDSYIHEAIGLEVKYRRNPKVQIITQPDGIFEQEYIFEEEFIIGKDDVYHYYEVSDTKENDNTFNEDYKFFVNSDSYKSGGLQKELNQDSSLVFNSFKLLLLTTLGIDLSK